uniref:Uncharacterized protein n=1 Tax=Heliothis virescens TaxID=7102 RepID=A0A2A4JCC8_HELVI
MIHTDHVLVTQEAKMNFHCNSSLRLGALNSARSPHPSARAQEKKIQARMKYLQEFNEKQRRERAQKAREKQNRIKQRVQAAAEMELRRKITMVRQWRANEKKRLNRVKQERESKLRRLENEANSKWTARVEAQNMKLQEEALLLKLYTEDMAAGAKRRAKKAEIYAYNTDLELQRIRLANWKLGHGGTAKTMRLVKKMGAEFEKSKRGAKGMSPELAQKIAAEAMSNAMSTQGDTLMILGQARCRMDIETLLPLAPIRLLDEANSKWTARVEAQNMKLQEEALLLKLYTEDMAAGAKRRAKKAEIYAYNTDLELQRIRLANWKLGHGGTAKTMRLVKKMGAEFEKSKRGAKGMSPELAQKIAAEAMSNAMSTQGDTLMILGQARCRMDIETLLPLAPIRLLDEMLEAAIMEFARRRVHQLLQDVEHVVQSQAAIVFFQDYRRAPGKKRSKPSRWASQIEAEMARHHARESMLGFGEAVKIPAEEESDIEFKSIKERVPTPVPSRTKLAEVTFIDRVEDLPDPVSVPAYLPERRKLLEMVHASAKLLSRSVSMKVDKGMDVTVGKVTLPKMRHPLEWGEAVEGLAMAVVDNRVHAECADVRRTCEFLTNRVLKNLQNEMKQERKELAKKLLSATKAA